MGKEVYVSDEIILGTEIFEWVMIKSITVRFCKEFF